MKKTILLVCYGGGHVHMVYPVVHALRQSDHYQQGGLTIKVLGLAGALPILKKNGIEPISMRDYLDPIQDVNAIRWGTKLAETNHSSSLGIPIEESIAYLGLCYQDLVTRHGESQAADLYARQGRAAFHPLTVMERILDAIKPDIVVTTNSPRTEAAAIEVANARNIPTLAMSDLFAGITNYRIKAKHVTFLCDLAVKMFMADGVVDPHISTFHVTGNPAFDVLMDTPKDKDDAWITEHFPAAKNKKLVLHADTQGYWDSTKHGPHYRSEAEITQELDAIYHAAKAHDAYYLVRTHPSQNLKLHMHWLENRPDAELAVDCDLIALLRNIDVLVVRSSTVATQGLYMQKKIIQPNPDIHVDLPFRQLKVAWHFDHFNELPSLMKEVLDDHQQIKTKLSSLPNLFPCQKASPVIASLIIKLLN